MLFSLITVSGSPKWCGVICEGLFWIFFMWWISCNGCSHQIQEQCRATMCFWCLHKADCDMRYALILSRNSWSPKDETYIWWFSSCANHNLCQSFYLSSWNVSTSTGWIVTKSGTDVHVPLRMNCIYFCDPLTFPETPSSCHHNTLVYDWIHTKLMTFPSVSSTLICAGNEKVCLLLFCMLAHSIAKRLHVCSLLVLFIIFKQYIVT